MLSPRRCSLLCSALVTQAVSFAFAATAEAQMARSKIDPCGLVTMGEVSAAVGKPVGAAAVTVSVQTAPSGVLYGSCLYQGAGFSTVIGFEQYPSTNDAAKNFTEALNYRKARNGALAGVAEPDIADGSYWRTPDGSASYFGRRDNRIVTVSVTGSDSTALTSVPQKRLRALMLRALSSR